MTLQLDHDAFYLFEAHFPLHFVQEVELELQHKRGVMERLYQAFAQIYLFLLKQHRLKMLPQLDRERVVIVFYRCMQLDVCDLVPSLTAELTIQGKSEQFSRHALTHQEANDILETNLVLQLCDDIEHLWAHLAGSQNRPHNEGRQLEPDIS